MPVKMASSKIILIVEDDRDLRRLYTTALRLAGFEVRESGNGFDALHQLDLQPKPDCVVLDLMLPVLSGQAVKQELAASAEMRHIPVVIVTGSDADVSDLGANCVLRKPATPEDLVGAVERCMAAGSGQTRTV
jgi:CheY-like chemotaxis protein